MIKKDYIYVGIIAIITAIALLKSCGGKEMESEVESTISFLRKRDSVNLLKINAQAHHIVILKQNIVTKETANKLLEKELKGYKNVKSFVEVKTVTSVKNLTIKYVHDTTTYLVSEGGDCISKDSVRNFFVQVPKQFIFEDKWMSLSGKVQKEGLDVDSVKFTNELEVILAYKKAGIFKKREPVVDIKSYSPYSKIEYANNIVIKDERSKLSKALTSKAAMVGYGILGAFLILNLK
jgi:hypothetical protein